ncbi:MAG: YceI family protein [Bacteroidetes bacterium]|nr:YceI family protein [Rhodothermia bacterium]MCS7154525.1 YceI family protein [Bacteroidota bacterium]MCX7906898.1 YceI family protein [Bacteroidota bacterium]MDW8285307.1 YceI family protein [Bacteroidota bacterium]
MHLSLLFLCAWATAAAWAQPKEWAVDRGQSQIIYRGYHPAHSWTGTSRDVRGAVWFDPERPGLTRVRIWAPVESFSSDNDNRDSNMLLVVEADRYPEVRFESDSVAILTWDGQRGQWRVSGRLQFHGQSRPISALVDVLRTAEGLYAKGGFRILLSHFGVRRPRLLLLPIRDELDIRFEILVRRPA